MKYGVNRPAKLAMAALIFAFSLPGLALADAHEGADAGTEPKEFSSNAEMILHVTDLCNRRMIEACFSYYHEDYRAHRPTGDQTGREASEKGFARLAATMPDFQVYVVEAFGEGEWLAVRWIMEGTHTEGELYGVPASGKKARMVVNQIMIIRDGKIVEGWEEFDRLNFMRQLGAEIELEGVDGDVGGKTGMK